LFLAAGQQMCIGIWQDKASGPLQVIHLGYGIGSFIVPQIAKPFLSQKRGDTITQYYIQNCLKLDNITANTTSNAEESVTVENTHFEYGYLIIAGVILSFACLFYIMFCCSYNKMKQLPHEDKPPKKSVREIFNFNACSPGHPYFAAVLFGLLFCWFYATLAIHVTYANFWFSYMRDEMCLDKDLAADIMSVFWIGYTLGRFVTFIVAFFIHMKVLLFVIALSNLFCSVVLYFFSANITVTWVFAFLVGFWLGPLYPGGIAWANRYLTMTGVSYTFTLFGASIGGISYNMLIGWFFENKGPYVLWYFAIAMGTFVCALATSMHLIARTRGDKYEREVDEVNDIELEDRKL